MCDSSSVQRACGPDRREGLMPHRGEVDMLEALVPIGSVRFLRSGASSALSRRLSLLGSVLAVGLISIGVAAAQAPPPLQPPPFPPENPITQPKTILGKILFWDEQVSSHDTVACGTCHRAGAGGSDPRVGINPGPDHL